MKNTYLLDTHTILWYLDGDEALSQTAKELIEDRKNEIYLSIVSIWEIAIKINIGKLTLPYSFKKLKDKLKNEDIKILPIQVEDTEYYLDLPFYHKDPFDRIIISQSVVSNIKIIGRDKIFDEYECKRIW